MVKLTQKSTVRESIDAWLESIASKYAPNTLSNYKNALRVFVAFLEQQGITIDTMAVSQISEEWLERFIENFSNIAPSTLHTYSYGIINWYKFLISGQLIAVDLEQARYLLESKCGKQTIRSLSRPSSYYELSRVVDHALGLAEMPTTSERERLILLRDRALIVTLADTRLTVVAIQSLRRGDVDWRRGHLCLDNKTISLSPRLLSVLLEYIKARSDIDDAAGRPVGSLPLFARHSPTGKRVLPVSTRYISTIVRKRIREALGPEDDGTITPVSFRYYFNATLLQSFATLHPKIVQRCQSLFETGEYDSAIFTAMKTVEDEVRSAISGDPTDIGVDLITKAMHPRSPLIVFSNVTAEQESAYFLYRGAIGSFKNPLSHRFIETSDPVKAFECLALASLLLVMLDEVTP